MGLLKMKKKKKKKKKICYTCKQNSSQSRHIFRRDFVIRKAEKITKSCPAFNKNGGESTKCIQSH